MRHCQGNVCSVRNPRYRIAPEPRFAEPLFPPIFGRDPSTLRRSISCRTASRRNALRPRRPTSASISSSSPAGNRGGSPLALNLRTFLDQTFAPPGLRGNPIHCVSAATRITFSTFQLHW